MSQSTTRVVYTCTTFNENYISKKQTVNKEQTRCKCLMNVTDACCKHAEWSEETYSDMCRFKKDSFYISDTHISHSHLIYDTHANHKKERTHQVEQKTLFSSYQCDVFSTYFWANCFLLRVMIWKCNEQTNIYKDIFFNQCYRDFSFSYKVTQLTEQIWETLSEEWWE